MVFDGSLKAPKNREERPVVVGGEAAKAAVVNTRLNNRQLILARKLVRLNGRLTDRLPHTVKRAVR